MKLKNNTALEFICEITGLTAEKVSERVIEYLLECNIITDEECHYNQLISWAILDSEFQLNSLVKTLFPDFPEGRMYLFGMLVTIGDGNCPGCGAEISPARTDKEVVSSGSYDIPDEVQITKAIYICPHCGKQHVTDGSEL